MALMALAEGAETAKGPSADMLATGGCSALVLWLVTAAAYALGVCGAVFSASWLLLALDAARNLHRIRLKLPGD